MKITLFGATGKTGPYLIQEGLKRGHQITVFARQQTHFYNQNVRLVRGDINNIDDLRKAIIGADAVLSALGPTKILHSKNLPITKATNNIIHVMKQEQITRFIAVSTGTAVDSEDDYDVKIRLPAAIIKYALSGVYKDIVTLAEVIRSSTLDWTMVRAGFLNNHPASGNLNVGAYGVTRHSLSLSREDLAKFMFDQINNDKFIKKAPGISSKKSQAGSRTGLLD